MQIPITTAIKIKPTQGSEDKCLQWMRQTSLLAAEFDGFMTQETYKSVDQTGLLVTVFTFDSRENMARWESSPKRHQQIERGNQYVDSFVEKEQFTGLELWFESGSTTAEPIKWKMLIVTIAVIFILLNSLNPVVQQTLALTGLPDLLNSFIGISFMVCLSTYVIMPFVSKRLWGWLVKP